MSSVFEPKTIIAILKNSSCIPAAEKKSFESNWKKAVDTRLNAWLVHRVPRTKKNSSLHAQLEWEAHVVEYVSLIYKETKCHGNAKATVPPNLPKDVPFLGPRFIPPTYLHERKRQNNAKIEPVTAYLKPLNVIHPLYYNNISRCPQCTSEETLWNGWTTTGHRSVHGVHEEETALGYQLICKICESRFSHAKGKQGHEEGMYRFATTNAVFWESWEHWEIPRNIPYFLRRCAVTHDLFDMIIEMRPSLTSMGLEEHIHQLHLLTYKQKMLEYLQNLQYRVVSPFRTDPLTAFSGPTDTDGYSDNWITNDTITHIFNEFSERTRKKESKKYLQTLSGTYKDFGDDIFSPSLSAKCLSLDNTFRSAAKATVVDKDKTRTKLMKGGILNVLNEYGEIVGWRFCLSASPDEITEFLNGYVQRCTTLCVAPPEMIVVDNCCQMRTAIQKAIPGVCVVLDVYHFLRRYLAVVINGVKNPNRSEVAKDITQAIIKTKAAKGVPATYWNHEDQVVRLEQAFEKWARKGNVWSVAATKVHAEQLRHVRKGCLTRTRHDIAADGSRIEASHKGWNSIQRSFASGIEMFSALAHDFVLRRNIRIASARKNKPAFIESMHGSHHISLTHRIAVLWNQNLKKEKKPSMDLLTLPELPIIDCHESFGLGVSKHVETFGGLIEVTEDYLDPELQCIDERFEEELEAELDTYFQGLDIDPAHRVMPLQDFSNVTVTQSGGSAGAASINTSKRKADSIDGPDAPVIKKPCTDVTTFTPNQMKVDNFFRSKAQQNQQFSIEKPLANAPALSVSTPTIQQLSKRLDLPDSHTLTRSQLLFSRTTGIDVRSLSIKADYEFHLFMDMRDEYQWVSYNMTAKKWATATHHYNLRLVELKESKGHPVVKKNPRALHEKLGEVETKITVRVANGDYISLKSKTDTFWRRHCHAVPLVKPENVNNSEAVKIARKPAMCGRCRTIMYPGLSGSPENHKKGFCSDGVKQAKDAPDAPDWPQPHGIFESGKVFHPVNFLKTLREVHEAVVVQGSDGGDFAMEYDAFLKMLHSRTIVTADGRYLFKLFDLALPLTCPGELIVEHEGLRYLQMDCLRDGDEESG